jgi:hypothetical protein
MKARVFISHSCKDSEAGGTEDAHRAAVLAYARNVRARVVSKLDAGEFEVWLDQLGLAPGDQWRAKLHRWLGSCNAAIVLLDEESVRSKWLLKEATVLAWRRDIGAPVTIVPALLGAFRAEDIAASPLSEIGLDWSQAARVSSSELSDENAEALATRIVASVQSVAAAPVRTDMERWIAAVHGILRRVEPDPYLLDAAEQLGITQDDWVDAGDDDATLAATLAHHLLYAPLDQTLDALEALRDGVESFRTLVDLVRPVWVDVQAGQCLNAYVGAAPPPIVVIVAHKFQTARDYVRRARFCQVKPERIIHGQLPTGMSPGREAEAAFLSAMGAEWNLSLPDDRDTILQALRDERVQRFVVFGPDPVPPAVIRELRQAHERLRFVVLRTRDHAETVSAALDAKLVRPFLGSGDEDVAHGKLTGIEELV